VNVRGVQHTLWGLFVEQQYLLVTQLLLLVTQLLFFLARPGEVLPPCCVSLRPLLHRVFLQLLDFLLNLVKLATHRRDLGLCTQEKRRKRNGQTLKRLAFLNKKARIHSASPSISMGVLKVFPVNKQEKGVREMRNELALTNNTEGANKILPLPPSWNPRYCSSSTQHAHSKVVI
jgi:hypothetical protein